MIYLVCSCCDRLLFCSIDAYRSSASFEFAITIYSYDRPRLVRNLLQDIEEQGTLHNFSRTRIALQVIDDNTLGCSDQRYWRRNRSENHAEFYKVNSVSELLQLPCAFPSRFIQVMKVLERNQWKLWVAKRRFSKYQHWKLISKAFQSLKFINASYYIFLQDDMRICTSFLQRATGLWNSIEDPQKMTLMLHIDENRVNHSCWTDIFPKKQGDVYKIGWVEASNYLCERSFLEYMGFIMPSVPCSRWYRRRLASSGVGELLSRLLVESNWNMYTTGTSLLYHIGFENSKMHPALRRKETISTHHFIDGDAAISRFQADLWQISCSMASTWPRIELLYDSIESLAHQIDKLYLYLNDYESVPSFLHTDFIHIFSSQQEETGDLGDNGKFYSIPSSDFHFTADDDIIYPEDYVDSMLEAFQSLRQPAILGVYGIILNQEKLFRQDYFHSRIVVSLDSFIPYPCQVHIIGTGAMLFQPRQINLSLKHFQYQNMADIYVSIFAKRNNITLTVINHTSNWLSEQTMGNLSSIYQRTLRNGFYRRKITNLLRKELPWKKSYQQESFPWCNNFNLNIST
eukprot:jgi/Galph1/646/GphlegSOOS_G5383.1